MDAREERRGYTNEARLWFLAEDLGRLIGSDRWQAGILASPTCSCLTHIRRLTALEFSWRAQLSEFQVQGLNVRQQIAVCVGISTATKDITWSVTGKGRTKKWPCKWYSLRLNVSIELSSELLHLKVKRLSVELLIESEEYRFLQVLVVWNITTSFAIHWIWRTILPRQLIKISQSHFDAEGASNWWEAAILTVHSMQRIVAQPTSFQFQNTIPLSLSLYIDPEMIVLQEFVEPVD